MALENNLLTDVKAHLILEHDEDDALLLGYIRAALSYAEGYQKRRYRKQLPSPTTRQAVMMLTAHFYESRDGSTAGFFADNSLAGQQVWNAVNSLLRLDRDWSKGI